MENNIASFVTMKEELSGMQIMRGHITAVTPEGDILVENELDQSCTICDFIRTTNGPLPVLNQGDMVLYISDETCYRGYVLGIIEKYLPREEMPSHLNFDAKERVELRCGKSSLTMSKEGKVILKGIQLVSRASGLNKIKGAAVKIN